MSIIDKLGASEQRLWNLIAERCEDSADLAAIDQKIWDLFGERWAIMFTDLAGFSRGTEKFGITHFLQVIHEHKVLVAPIIDEHQGFLLKIDGDSMLALFRKPASALKCAVEMQRACQRLSSRRVGEEAILLCVGLGHGDVLRVGEHEVFGAQVNAAAKLGEDVAKANEILVTEAIEEACRDADGLSFEALEAGIPGAKRAYRVHYGE